MNSTVNANVKQRLRALVLDDDAAALEGVRRALEARRFSVSSAGDGTSGVELLLDELLDLDVLVTDADLPHRDGRALADLVRRAGGERDLAIVVLASEATPELRAELLALEVDAVVERSAGPEALAEAVLDAVAARTSPSSRVKSQAASGLAAAAARWALSFRRWSVLPV